MKKLVDLVLVLLLVAGLGFVVYSAATDGSLFGTPTPTAIRLPRPTRTAKATSTFTITYTSTATAKRTPTATITLTVTTTVTSTQTPTSTETPTPTASPIGTPVGYVSDHHANEWTSMERLVSCRDRDTKYV